ncbi:MAG: hypothetical protein R6U32_05850 [Candidatus Woesearchaeota archaeon]
MHYKAFPRIVEGRNYPVWEEVSLTEKEEFVQDNKAKRENIKLMKRCIEDARKMLDEMGLREYQSDVLGVALALFRKHASHAVYWKDSRCKEKFDRRFRNTVAEPQKRGDGNTCSSAKKASVS